MGLESNDLPVWLRAAGYQADLVGKYLNGYGRAAKPPYDDTYVPPGWSDWFGEILGAEDGSQGHGYYDYKMVDNGTPRLYGSDPSDYSAGVDTQRAISDIQNTPDGKPLFVYLAFKGPHSPATPPPGTNRCRDYVQYQPPNFGVTGANAPSWIKRHAWTATNTATEQTLNIKRCRTLVAIDDGVGQIMQALHDTGRLNNTLVIFTSDNGWSAGSHRWEGKRVPWNESLRVPLIMRWDGHIAPDTHNSGIAVNVDWAETMADAAGATVPAGREGRSLFDLLNGDPWRSDFLIESYNPGWVATQKGALPPYCGVRSLGWLYVKYQTGEQELYDEVRDPFELSNLANDPAYANQLAAMHARMVTLCSPPPPGFTP
jgi:arylsulfatase A-like enzyme